MKRLTRRQQDVLGLIEASIRTKGYPPSVREIASQLNLLSASGVHKHIKALVRKNVLSKEAHLSRSLRILTNGAAEPAPNGATPGGPLLELPLRGSLTADVITEVSPEDAPRVTLPAPPGADVRDAYALRVSGDSRLQDGFHDGDLLIVSPHLPVHDGALVLATLAARRVALKHFHKVDDRVRLDAGPGGAAPVWVPAHEVQVQGVVVGLWRRYN
jgi:repressor LexA